MFGTLRASRWYRALWYVLGIAMAIGCVPFLMPVPGHIRNKLHFFAAHRDDYDLVFFGSSVTQKSISPPWFDDALKTKGIRMQSFNMAFAGSSPYEVDHLIQRVVDLEPARLRWVVLDWLPWEPHAQLEKYGRRSSWWRRPSHTLLLLRGVLEEEMPLREKGRVLGRRMKEGFIALAGVGRGPEIIAYLARGEKINRGIRKALERRGGFVALGEGFSAHYWPDAQEGRRRFLRIHEEFLAQVQREREQIRRWEGGAGGEERDYAQTERALRRQISILRDAGVEPVYVLYPSNPDYLAARILHERGSLPNLILLDDPDRHPELFLPEHRFDTVHFNRQGAKLATLALAEAFARLHEAQEWAAASPVRTR